jgi:hypothetical protein
MVLSELQKSVSGDGVPNLYCVVTAGRSQFLSIFRKGDLRYLKRMSDQRPFFSAFYVAEINAMVVGSRCQRLTIRGKRQASKARVSQSKGIIDTPFLEQPGCGTIP